MRNIIALILMIIGFGTIIFGGTIVLIYCVYNLIMEFDTMMRSEVFWEIFLIIIRDLVTVLIGFVLIGISYLLKKE